MTKLSLTVAMGLLAMASGCTRAGGDKASLPPPDKTTAAAETGSEQKPVETQGTQGTSADVASEPSDADVPAEAQAEEPAASADAQPAEEAAPRAQAQGADVRARLTGEIYSDRKSELGFRVAGFIAKIDKKPGEVCKRGDVIATLDDRDYKLRLQLAKAKVELSQVAQETAKKELERERQLQADNVSVEASFDKVKSGFDQARIQLELAQLELKSAEQALGDTKLRAPYDCVVAAQMKYNGESVQPGTPVVQIYDVGAPELELSAPERLMGQFQVGDVLKVTIPSVNFQGQAKVSRVVPVIADRSRTFRIYAKMTEPDRRLVPGLYAEAAFE